MCGYIFSSLGVTQSLGPVLRQIHQVRGSKTNLKISKVPASLEGYNIYDNNSK